MVADGVEDVNLGVVERDHDVLLGQMQARHYTLFGRDLARIAYTAVAPCRLDHVTLLEMRPVCYSLVSPL